MPSVFPTPVRDLWNAPESPVTLGTTASFIQLPPEAYGIELFCDVDFLVGLNPRLMRVIFYDQSAGTFTDITDELQDGDTDVAQLLNSMTTLDAIYIKTARSINGLYLDLGNKNSNDSIMTLSYWNGTWTSASATDGTSSTGKTMAQDGTVYWAAKTDELEVIGSILSSGNITTYGFSEKGFWYKITVSADLDTTVQLLRMMSLTNRSSAGLPLYTWKGSTYHCFSLDREFPGSIIACVASGAGSLIIGYVGH